MSTSVTSKRRVVPTLLRMICRTCASAVAPLPAFGSPPGGLRVGVTRGSHAEQEERPVEHAHDQDQQDRHDQCKLGHRLAVSPLLSPRKPYGFHFIPLPGATGVLRGVIRPCKEPSGIVPRRSRLNTAG